jgi:hypothetical protein
MNIKIKYLQPMFIGLLLCGFTMGDIVDESAAEYRIECKLFSYIEDLPTAGFRDVTVEEISKSLSVIAKLTERTCGHLDVVGRRYGFVRFEVVADRKTEKYWIELLAIPNGEDENKWKVVNARIVYVARSGVAFYNNLIPPQWPVAVRQTECETKPSPTIPPATTERSHTP